MYVCLCMSGTVDPDFFFFETNIVSLVIKKKKGQKKAKRKKWVRERIAKVLM